MAARVYKPAKSAMQSGDAQTRNWVLELERQVARSIDPLMGWTSTADTATQVRLEFSSREEAVAYAERNGIPYTLTDPKPRRHIKKSYAENFAFGRIGTWTH